MRGMGVTSGIGSSAGSAPSLLPEKHLLIYYCGVVFSGTTSGTTVLGVTLTSGDTGAVTSGVTTSGSVTFTPPEVAGA